MAKKEAAVPVPDDDPAPAAKRAPAPPLVIRVQLDTHNPEAKVFTSKGPLVCGSVVELPVAEARRLIDLKMARISEAECERIEPTVNVELEKYVDPE